MTRKRTQKAKRLSNPPARTHTVPPLPYGTMPANGESGGTDSDAPPGDVQIPRALLLHQRRRLEAHRVSAQSELLDQQWAKMFEGAMYPATMGPDQVNDRMGYGELLRERRSDGRDILRTRSGSVPLGAEAPVVPAETEPAGYAGAPSPAAGSKSQ